jgi:L-aspartate oxidase
LIFAFVFFSKGCTVPHKEAELRRYLINVDTAATNQLFTNVLVVGAGVAGLRAAIEAAQYGSVILTCKGKLSDSNTWNAQGGIASVLEKTDSFESHIADTLATGCNINDKEIVELVVRQGPSLIRQLLEWGTEFDKADGRIDIGLEGGHSHPRIIHGHGDSTGRAIAESLIRKVKANSNIRVIENFFTIDLITNGDNQCIGIIGNTARAGMQIIWAAGTILATGGAGQLYRETTNPSVATGDGLAMAYRAGAVMRDMEFMQFHPTTLYIAGASRALITETLRGEGGILLDANGCRFMPEYHESAELAPRDIVSRAILSQMLKTNATHVYLDIRHLNKDYFKKRFPLISELCESFDIDVSRDLIPVRPSAHYMIGGVKTDAKARTSIKNLYACGEVSSSGLHGANRLGSNSLLEGLVFGKVAGSEAGHIAKTHKAHPRHPSIRYEVTPSDRSRLDTDDVRNSLRSVMWRNVGITRRQQPLREAQEIIGFWQRYVMDKVFDTPEGWECQNMLTVCLLMAQAALQRQESRGVHFRSDFPKTDDGNFAHHIELVRAIM